MFGQFGQIANLLKNAGKIKDTMKEMNARLEAARYTGEAGGGQVKATVDGRCELVAIKIEPVLVQGGDVELLEDLVLAAARDAAKQARDGLQKEMGDMTGGLGLGGLGDLGSLMGG